MKYLLRIFILPTLAFAYLLSFQACATLIELSVSDEQVEVGDSFTLNINVLAPFADLSNARIYGFGFNLQFDSTALSLVQVTMDDQWMDVSSAFPHTDFAGSSLLGLADSEQSTIALAQFEFIARDTGALIINAVSSVLRHGEQGLFFLDGDKIVSKDINASAKVTSRVPVAHTLLILLLAMSLVAVKRTN